MTTTPRSRPWRIIYGYSDRHGVSFEPRTGAPHSRSYGSEEAARAAAIQAVAPANSSFCYFPAVRLTFNEPWDGDWDARWAPGKADEYTAVIEGGEPVGHRLESAKDVLPAGLRDEMIGRSA